MKNTFKGFLSLAGCITILIVVLWLVSLRMAVKIDLLTKERDLIQQRIDSMQNQVNAMEKLKNNIDYQTAKTKHYGHPTKNFQQAD